MLLPNLSLGEKQGGGDTGGTPTLSPTGHLVVAVCLGFIGIIGFLSNLFVLVLFCRYKVLRSPINCVLMSISASDMLVCVLGTPFSFAASTQGRWLLGHTGCVWYGFINSCLGIVSLVSLAFLSYERYCTMMAHNEADDTNYTKISAGIVLSWGYSVMWTVPPLFGWSNYGPEGPGTTCSVNWAARDANSISYILCLFLFCLVVPFSVIVYSYVRLLQAIKQVARINTALSRRREQQVLLMVVVMVICYLVCWLPYSVVALLASFGRPGLVTPVLSIVPSLLAKCSTAINPIIYIFMNKQVLPHSSAVENISSSRGSSRPTKITRSALHTNSNCITLAMATCNQRNKVQGPPKWQRAFKGVKERTSAG